MIEEVKSCPIGYLEHPFTLNEESSDKKWMCDGRYVGNFYGSCSDYAIHEGTYYTCSN